MVFFCFLRCRPEDKADVSEKINASGLAKMSLPFYTARDAENRWMWKEWLKSMKKPVIPMSPAQTEMSGR